VPKIYEYLGILIFFYSNEHEPIHVHAHYENQEIKAEFYLENGEIKSIRLIQVRGLEPLSGSKLKDFEDFLGVYANEIVRKRVDYFVYHKKVVFERINTRLK
jgi:hypothetical protein